MSIENPQTPEKSEKFPGNIAFAPALLDPDLEVPDGIIGPDGNCPPKRFSVYRNNVVISLMEAMGQTYPSSKILLGEENFATVSRIYISQYPPRTAMMQSYGDKFPEFLLQFEPLQNSPFLIDLAMLEKRWLQAYHARDALPLEGAALGAIDPQRLMETKFATHPAAFIVPSNFDLNSMFCARDHQNPEQVNYIATSNLGAMLITRPVYDVNLTPLDPPQAVFFHALMNQQPLGQCVETAMASDENFDPSPAITLMLTTGAIEKIIQ